MGCPSKPGSSRHRKTSCSNNAGLWSLVPGQTACAACEVAGLVPAAVSARCFRPPYSSSDTSAASSWVPSTAMRTKLKMEVMMPPVRMQQAGKQWDAGRVQECGRHVQRGRGRGSHRQRAPGGNNRNTALFSQSLRCPHSVYGDRCETKTASSMSPGFAGSQWPPAFICSWMPGSAGRARTLPRVLILPRTPLRLHSGCSNVTQCQVGTHVALTGLGFNSAPDSSHGGWHAALAGTTLHPPVPTIEIRVCEIYQQHRCDAQADRQRHAEHMHAACGCVGHFPAKLQWCMASCYLMPS